MKRFLVFCLLFFVSALEGQEVIALPQSKNGFIVPGESVAGVNLKGDFASFEALFPKHPQYDEDYPGFVGENCPERSYHWLDINLDSGPWYNGVYVYLINGKIVQLSVHTPRFSLPNGIKVEANEVLVKHFYPNGRRFVLLYSGGKDVGGRDLVYWVDKGAGVAFEFYWNSRKKQRLVSGIDIFLKGSDFWPEGCVSRPQQWKELKQSAQ